MFSLSVRKHLWLCVHSVLMPISVVSSPCQLKTWSVDELQRRLSALDPMMEQEIEEIRQKYQSKRQPILDAIEAKKRRQQNF